MKQDIGLMTNLNRELIKRPILIEYLQSDKPIIGVFDLLENLSVDRLNQYKSLYLGLDNSPIHTIYLPNNNTLDIKLECHNPMGNNHYSRYWILHLALVESFGIIEPHITKIVEVSSGSSGISMSIACQILGYNLTMIVPNKLPLGRIKPMEDCGTKVIKVDGYIDICIAKLKEVLAEDNYYAANHSEEKSNLITYVFKRIASEYIQSKGSPDIAILGLGNGTSTEAMAKRLKEDSEDTLIYSYYPELDSKQVIFGLYGPNVSLRHIEPAMKLVDKMFYTSDMDLEGLLDEFKNDQIIQNLGISSLYAVKFALNLSSTIQNTRILSIGYDQINRYANE